MIEKNEKVLLKRLRGRARRGYDQYHQVKKQVEHLRSEVKQLENVCEGKYVVFDRVRR